ncbi:hypothetical protein [Nostoc sp.]
MKAKAQTGDEHKSNTCAKQIQLLQLSNYTVEKILPLAQEQITRFYFHSQNIGRKFCERKLDHNLLTLMMIPIQIATISD